MKNFLNTTSMLIITLFLYAELLYKCLSIEFYVQTSSCSKINSCSGAENSPFPSLEFALQKIFEKQYSDNEKIQLHIKEESLEMSVDSGSGELMKLNYFKIVSGMILEINSAHPNGQTNLKFVKGINFGFMIINGRVKFENMIFTGNTETDELVFNITGLIKNPLSRAFLLIQAIKESMLEIINCKFIGILTNPGLDDFGIMSLIQSKPVENPSSTFIYLENTEFFDLHYPQGVIYTEGRLNGELEVKLKNITFQNYRNIKFLHWENKIYMSSLSREYFDFAIILNNTIFKAEKLLLKNSSRFLLADTSNTLTFDNLKFSYEFDKEASEHPSPEFLYLIKENNLTTSNMQFFNLSIFSFDDMINIHSRDSPIFESLQKIYPPYLLDFERCQSFIKFGIRNKVEWKDLTITDAYFYRKANLVLSVFHLELNNSFSIENLRIENFVIETDSKIGCQAFFKIEVANIFSLLNLNINNIESYSYSSFNFFYAILKNIVTLKNLKFNNTVFKSKSNTKEINNFRNYIVSSGSNIAFEDMKNFKCLAYSAFILGNQVIVENSFSENLICLYGCFVSCLTKNFARIINSNFTSVMSEMLSSYVALGINNTFIGENLNVTLARSNTGLYHVQFNNEIKLSGCYIDSSWGQGGFDFFEFYSGGFLSLIYDNTFIFNKSLIRLGKSDIMAGGITAGLRNKIIIGNCTFEKIESSNTISDAGVIYIDINNTIIMENTIFQDNYGNNGGVIWANRSNFIQFASCIFMANKGIKGSVLYSMYNNTIRINESRLIKNKGYLEGGLLILIGNNQKIYFNNCIFQENETPIKGGALLNISSNNIFFFENILIEYGENGVGSFCFVKTENLMFISNLTIKNSYELKILITIDKKNNLTINSLKFFDSSIEENFFIIKEENVLKIFNLTVSNVSVQGMTAKMIWAEKGNYILIENLKFTKTQSLYYIIILLTSNTMYIYNFTLDLMLFYSTGTLIKLDTSNDFMINSSIIKNFEGIKNEVFLMNMETNNKAILLHVAIQGYFKSEQGENNSTLIRCRGTDNSFKILYLNIDIVNPLNSISYISLISVEGESNLLSIEHCLFMLKNLTSIMDSKSKNKILLSDIYVDNCDLLSDFFIFNDNFVNITKIFFTRNKIVKNNYLIKLLNKSNCLAKFVTLNNNNNFLFLSQSRIVLNTSKINSCKQKSNVNITGRVMFLENYSYSLYYLVEIVCRANLFDSNINIYRSSITFIACFIGFNEAFKGGFADIDLESNLTLYRNFFILNKVYLGGVMKLSNFNTMVISNNYFILNKAFRYHAEISNKTPGKGGCFYTEHKGSNFSLYFFNNSLNKNEAEIGGIIFMVGVFLIDKLKSIHLPQINQMLSSKAKFYGTTWASYASTYLFKKETDLNLNLSSRFIQLSERVVPGKNLTKCAAQIITLDYSNQITFGDMETQESIIINNSVRVYFKIVNNFPCLYSITPLNILTLTTYAEEEMQFKFYVGLFLKNNTAIENSSLSISFMFRKCTLGEYFDLKTLQCIECEPNFFSFADDFLDPSSCQICSLKPFNCYGGFNLTPKSKYWRVSQSSTNFLKCPIETACLGDLMIGESTDKFSTLYFDFKLANPIGSCAFGYKGILCNLCEKGYSKIDGVKCSLCDTSLSIILIILKIILRIFLYIYMILKALSFCKSLRKNKIGLGLVYSNFMLKIMVLHIQFLRVFFNFPVSLPNYFDQFFGIFSISFSSGIDKAMNLDCYYNFKNIKELYLNMIITVFSPIIFVIFTRFFSIISQIIKEKLHKRRLSKIIQSQIQTNIEPRLSNSGIYSLFKDSFLFYLILICLMLSYDEIISRLMENFSYININDGKYPEYRVVNNFEIDYYSTEHQYWSFLFALPVSLIYGLLIPFFILINILLGKKRNLLTDVRFLSRFGYFIFAYDEKHIFYEFFYTFRKMLLIVLDIFFIRIFTLSSKHNPISYMIIMGFVFTYISFYSNMRQPYNKYKYPKLNRIETLFLNVQAMMCWSGALFLSIYKEENPKFFELIRFAFYCNLVLLNFVAFGFWIYNYWKLSVKEKISNIFNKLKSKVKLIKSLRVTKFDIRPDDTTKRDSNLQSVRIFEDENKGLEYIKENFKTRKTAEVKILNLQSLILTLKQENDYLRSRLNLLNSQKPHSFENSVGDELPINDNEVSPQNINSNDFIKVSERHIPSPSSFSNPFLRLETRLDQNDGEKKLLSLLNEKFLKNSSLDQTEKVIESNNDFVVICSQKRCEGFVFKGFSLQLDLHLIKRSSKFDIKDLEITATPHQNFFIHITKPILSNDEGRLSFSLKLKYDSLDKMNLFENIFVDFWRGLYQSKKASLCLEVNFFDFLCKIDDCTSQNSSFSSLQKICSNKKLDLDSNSHNKDSLHYHFPNENLLLDLITYELAAEKRIYIVGIRNNDCYIINDDKENDRIFGFYSWLKKMLS